MKSLKQFTSPAFLLVLIFSAFTVACSSSNTETLPGITTTAEDGSTTVVDTALDDVLSTLPLDDLSQAEVDGLLFMREEEKLARDVYIYLFAEWGQKIFDNISQSEQSHTDAILALLERYDITDPVGDNAEGVFENEYLQGLYDALIAAGSASLIDALYVGAEIEEIDILDIQELVDALEGNEDVAIVYESLLKGSRNHLRAYVSNLEKQNVVYEPRHLTPEAYEAIINTATEN